MLTPVRYKSERKYQSSSICPGTPLFWAKCKPQSCHNFSIYPHVGIGQDGGTETPCLGWWMLSCLFPSTSWNMGSSAVVFTSCDPEVPQCEPQEDLAKIPAPPLGICMTSRVLVNIMEPPLPHLYNWIKVCLVELFRGWHEITKWKTCICGLSTLSCLINES